MTDHILNIDDIEYRDSDKVGVLAQFPAQDDGPPVVMRYIIRGQQELADYWDGE